MWGCYNYFSISTLHLRFKDFLKSRSDLLIIKELFWLHIWRVMCFISSLSRVVTSSWKRRIAVAVMRVALQWDSHSKTRGGQLWGHQTSWRMDQEWGMRLLWSLFDTASVWCASSLPLVSAPFLLNGFWVGNRVGLCKEEDDTLSLHPVLLGCCITWLPFGATGCKTTPPWLGFRIFSKGPRLVCLVFYAEKRQILDQKMGVCKVILRQVKVFSLELDC